MKNTHKNCNLFSCPVFSTALALTMIISILAAQPIPAACASRKATVFRTKGRDQKLKKMKVSSRSVRLKWHKTKDATGYQVYRSISKKGGFRRIASTGKNYITNKKLTPGKTYFYKVRAYRTVKKKKSYSRFSSVLKVRTKKTNNSEPTLTPLPTDTPAIAMEKHTQALNYQESTEQIHNPDQGFYRPIYVRVTEDGASNREPELTMILQHITQLSAILDKYHDTLTAIEVGLIGPWGEMHTSTMANKEVINALIDSYLNHTTEIPVLVRTPQMIYNYLGITINDIDTYQIASTSNAYRLGLFNDGYLGSSSDLGTYTKREKEIPWLALQNGHLPYGGEVVVPDSTLHNIENCLDEMFQLHLSYLNVEWNNIVIDKWKNSLYTDAAGKDSLYYGKTAFQYIENHMGYRFVLKNATLEYDETVSQFAIDLLFQNVGFGNLNRAMNMTLLLQANTGETIAIDAGQFNGGEQIRFQTNLNLPDGDYKVYLKLDKGNDRYALRFANDLWNEELQANQIGSFTK